MHGNHGSNIKSTSEVQGLVDNVLRAPEFDLHDFEDGYHVERETSHLDHIGVSTEYESTSACSTDWHEASVPIQVPDGQQHTSEEENPIFHVPGLHYRPLMDIIRNAASGNAILAIATGDVELPSIVSLRGSCMAIAYAMGNCPLHGQLHGNCLSKRQLPIA
jgi:hypothetical protein